MEERTVEQIVAEARYAREHADGAMTLPTVLAAWVKAMADDIEFLTAKLDRLET